LSLNLELTFHGVTIEIINDTYDNKIPVVRLSLNKFKSKLRLKTIDTKNIFIGAIIQIDCYNFFVSAWEPVVEPFFIECFGDEFYRSHNQPIIDQDYNIKINSNLCINLKNDHIAYIKKSYKN
jgi:hypothetical protein